MLFPFSSSVGCLMFMFMFIIMSMSMSMSLAMGMIFMAFPRMSPTQYYRTILLSPVQNPKPHDGAHALPGKRMPTLRLMHCEAFVCRAVSISAMAPSHFSL
uniref:Uncharacterized protein n=1 Tax=Davidia involucrata TaxID=16924 RepID=A0A5B6ZFG8_DAVIN